MENERMACTHDWEPWFTVIARAGLCFFFPGARCVRCQAEKPCTNDPARALKAFRKQFGVPFQVFTGMHETQIEEIRRSKDCLGWRIATPEDYRIIPSE